MFWMLVEKEIKHNVLSLKFMIVWALLFVLIIASTLMLATSNKKRSMEYRAFQKRQREVLEEMESSYDLRQGVTIAQRPPALSPLATGLEKETSRSVHISSYSGSKQGPTAYTNPLFSLISSPDLGFVVSVIVSLLALLLTFDGISGENAGGTLKQTMADSVPRHVFLLGKWLGGYLSLAVPFLLAALIGLAIAVVTGQMDLDTHQWTAIRLLLGLSLLYISVFCTMGLFISTITHRPPVSLMICLFLWIFLVLAVPNLMPVLAGQMVETPSVSYLARMRQAIEAEEWRKASPEIKKADDYDAQRELIGQVMETIDQRWTEVKTKAVNKRNEQIIIASWLSRLSPSASYTFAASNFAGTGLLDYRGLGEQVERYEDDFRQAAVEIREEEVQAQKEAGGEPSWGRWSPDDVSKAVFNIEKVPKYEFVASSLTSRLKASLIDIVLLALLNIALFMGALAGFLRYDLCK
ncbi:ABC transporter permease subunit [Candidatus Hydrogenedentota bacterium]